MTIVSPEPEPIFNDNEVVLGSIELDDSVEKGGVFDVYLSMNTAPILGGIPTDPNYCATLSTTTGRKITVHVLVDNRTATQETFCVASSMPRTFNISVPVPDGADPGTRDVSLYFVMADTTENQFEQSYNGGPESTVVTQVDIDHPADGGNGGTDDPGAEWVEVDPTGQVEEGDELKISYCVFAPDIPFNELLGKFQIEKGKLTGEINNQVDCMETEVVGTNFRQADNLVVEGDECEFVYTTRLKVKSVDGSCSRSNLTYSSIPTSIVVAVAILIAGIGVSLTLWRTEKLLTGESGDRAENVVSDLQLPLILGGGALLLSEANKATDDD